jgi:hypothetical protein
MNIEEEEARGVVLRREVQLTGVLFWRCSSLAAETQATPAAKRTRSCIAKTPHPQVSGEMMGRLEVVRKSESKSGGARRRKRWEPAAGLIMGVL